ncbi:MAG: 3'(2'),5'-bisphosphate nucleotidase CysQ [Alphaproteobacteria bacterium]|nr:3'(2'),5'-bisphosphate nucleotidase CysQ [Alphaproteobacteria bacterium SS10]
MLSPIREIAKQAGEVIMEYYQPDGMDEVIAKGDGSPVTIADREAEALITPLLRQLTPDVPVIGEEASDGGSLPDISGGQFWLVDPLDGTKDFIKGLGEFTVNIALVLDGRPVMGVIYAPAIDEEYGACGVGTAFERRGNGADTPIEVVTPDLGKLRILGSRNHGNPEALEKFMNGREVGSFVARSSSLKFCEVAAGRADIYPRFGNTCEWDTAAGQAILEGAGGVVTSTDGGLFPYAKADRKFLNDGFIAWGGVGPAEWLGG